MHQKLTSTLSQYDKIVLVGGGTGGHIQPIVSLVHSLDIESNNYLWIGGADSTEEKTAKENDIEFQSIPTLKLETTRSWRSLLYPFYTIAGFWRARQILQVQEKTEENIAVFSKGGPGSVAIGLAAWSLYIPLHIHESDTVPGRSNKILAKFANTIFLGFASAGKYFDTKKCEIVGQILDPMFEGQVSSIKHKIEWKTSKKHILVICGSQGSRAIFEEIVKNYAGNDEYEWIISLGKLNTRMKKNFEKIPDCQALEWIAQIDIAHLIQDTDLAITRGSATTLAELTAFQSVKLVIIPLPYSAGNHQYYNALEYEKMGHRVLEQKNLHQLTETIQYNV
ncbi:UDP-N-acetylglucosamine--N-acetylmuramyl-(pentapeptide) pyrophosphoryl-undecaprenol N-acetylglucosamine transferase [Candidatus Gracilibacteria bacterium]|nr:UDP-N-acetylglucosamine--N-acetylmuramyl-(pentapeptide) pyrophosphoryl-undecaprenol N-acetylglucosamine transferase [Candidatus Gracilibacteria bacterium]